MRVTAEELFLSKSGLYGSDRPMDDQTFSHDEDRRNQEDTRPKYMKIRDAIYRKYIAGRPSNSVIPPERKLAEEFKASRVTIRKAIGKLEADNVVYKVQGGGTYTVEPGIVKSLKLTSFSEDIRARGMVPSSRVLLHERAQADREASWRLKVSPGADVYLLRRLRLADGEPMCLEEVTVPLEYVPDIEKQNITGSFYDVLQHKYGLLPVWADQVVSPVVLEPGDVKLLQVAPYSPALKIVRVTFDAKGRRIETTTSLYRGDKYMLHYAVKRD